MIIRVDLFLRLFSVFHLYNAFFFFIRLLSIYVINPAIKYASYAA